MATPPVSNPPRDWCGIHVSGPDAKDFLDRLSTIAVKQLKVDSGQDGFFLEPNGRIVCAVTLWNLKDGKSYFLEFDGGPEGFWKTRLLAHLDQYLFSEDLEIKETELKPQWVFNDENEPYSLEQTDGGLLCHHPKIFNQAWNVNWTTQDPIEISWAELNRQRIAQFYPWPGIDYGEKNNPLEIGQRSGIAEKGCYPGQEVIEKIISLGSPAKRLCLVKGDLRPELELLNPDGKVVGKVSSCHLDLGFTILGKTHADVNVTLKTAHDQTVKIMQVSKYD